MAVHSDKNYGMYTKVEYYCVFGNLCVYHFRSHYIEGNNTI